MTPDELRALADALEPLASLERSGSQGALALESTIAYLRALADAQPVTWIAHNLTTGHVKWTTDRCRARGWTRSVNLRVKPLYAHPAPAVPAGWKVVPVEPTPEMLSAVGMMDGYDWHAPGCSPDADHANWYSAMIAAAPAVPQAEPIADSDADYWLRNRQAILDAIERAGFVLMSNASGFWLHPRGTTDAQAEPKREDQPVRDLLAIIHCDGGHHTEAVGLDQSIKDAQAAVCELKREIAMGKREPLTYEQLVSACYTYRHDFGLLDPDEQHLVIEEAGRWAKAFGIGGRDE